MSDSVAYQILSYPLGLEFGDQYRDVSVHRRPSCMVFLDADETNYYNGRLPNGLYSVRFGRRTPMMMHRIADFLRYETGMGRTTIVYSEFKFDIEKRIREALAVTPDPSLSRDYDPAIVVHSTPEDRLQSIVSSGAILPASMVRPLRPQMRLVGFEELGEPPEYVNFVHFASFGGATGEVIVLSHRDGRINTDFDSTYTPGARIYLSFDLLRKDGKLRRDGLHMAKADGPVSLDRYAIDIITEGDLPKRSGLWTPRTFARAADAEFASRHPELGSRGSP